MKKNIVLLIAVLTLIAAVVWQNEAKKQKASPASSGMTGTPSAGAQDPAAPKKGSSAPAFTLNSLDGKTAYEVGGKREKLLLINFWASWCGPCEQEAPDLKTLYDKYKDKMDLYAVNVTNYDTLRGAKDFVKEQGFTFPVLTDAKGQAGNRYKVFNYPTSFIVDRNGQIRERIEGIIPLKEWEQHLEPLT